MSTCYIRNEDETVRGPYEPTVLKAWMADGRLDDRVEFSADTVTWRYARDLPELGGSSGIATPPGGFPEPSILIRQGANVQGPYRMSRVRGYVKQRRVQHYMLFSEDGIFWVGPEHVPGLLPKGYTPVAPPTHATAIPADGSAPAEAATAIMPAGTQPPAPGEDIGSTTLVGFRLEEEHAAPAPSLPPPPPPRTGSLPPLVEQDIATLAGPALYHVRPNGHDVYGPCTEDVLREWIAEGRITATAEFSSDGRRTWTPGAQMDALFPRAPARRVPGGNAPTPRPSTPTRRRR